MKKITVYNDPGHAWAAVKISELEALDIAHKISPYSYMRGKTAYLEEDCDLNTYLAALKHWGQEIELLHKYTDRISPIRSYSAYKPPHDSARFMRDHLQIIRVGG